MLLLKQSQKGVDWTVWSFWRMLCSLQCFWTELHCTKKCFCYLAYSQYYAIKGVGKIQETSFLSLLFSAVLSTSVCYCCSIALHLSCCMSKWKIKVCECEKCLGAAVWLTYTKYPFSMQTNVLPLLFFSY